jgi:hypothetical protein
MLSDHRCHAPRFPGDRYSPHSNPGSFKVVRDGRREAAWLYLCQVASLAFVLDMGV